MWVHVNWGIGDPQKICKRVLWYQSGNGNKQISCDSWTIINKCMLCIYSKSINIYFSTYYNHNSYNKTVDWTTNTYPIRPESDFLNLPLTRMLHLQPTSKTFFFCQGNEEPLGRMDSSPGVVHGSHGSLLKDFWMFEAMAMYSCVKLIVHICIKWPWWPFEHGKKDGSLKLELKTLYRQLHVSVVAPRVGGKIAEIKLLPSIPMGSMGTGICTYMNGWSLLSM